MERPVAFQLQCTGDLQSQIKSRRGTAAAFLITTKMRPDHISESATRTAASPAVPGLRALARRRKSAGFTVIQAVVAMGVIAVSGAASMMALVQLNNKAAAMRTLNNARAVLQRNIDTALSVAFSPTQQPAVLAITSATGSVYEDETDGDNLVTIVTPKSSGGTTVKGTLTRIVTAQANSDGADIRRITFRIDYAIRGRAYTYSMTTLRGSD